MNCLTKNPRILFLLAATALVLSTVVTSAELVATRSEKQIKVTGDHFKITIDLAKGGEISEITLFDGSLWNQVLGADGQTCPSIELGNADEQYKLSRSPETTVKKYSATPDLIHFQTSSVPLTKDGKSGPWTITLEYEIYPSGAIFVDMLYSIGPIETELKTASVSMQIDKKILASPKYHSKNMSYTRLPCFPTARFAFGVNPERTYTNEIEAALEYRCPVGDTTLVRPASLEPKRSPDGARLTWPLSRGEGITTIKGPYTYHNRFSLGLGAGTTARKKSNIIGHRIYGWMNWFHRAPQDRWYPTHAQIDQMAEKGATVLFLGQDWMRQYSSCGYPHADYTQARDHDNMLDIINYAHQRGLRVLIYMRATEPYGLDSNFFQTYCRRDWDGIYIDWHGMQVVMHEFFYKPDPKFEKAHHSDDATYNPARDYFLFSQKLREIVGPKGLLLGHSWGCDSGILASLTFDGYVSGEYPAQWNMFSNLDTLGRDGMLAGVVATPWPVSKQLRTPEAIAKMAAWGCYPVALVSFKSGDLVFPLNLDDPINAYPLQYWRILKTIDPDKTDVYNWPSENLIAATCSNRDFYCLVYKENQDSYLLIVANLGSAEAQSEIKLVPEVLSLQGEYRLSRINPADGTIQTLGTTTGSLQSSLLAPWQFEGFKLQR